MTPFANYLLEVSLGTAVVFFIYTISLKGKTFFQLNRVFLLSGLIISLVVPLISLPENFFQNAQALPEISMRKIQTEYVPFTFSENESASFNLRHLLSIVYSAGVVLLGCRFLLGIFKVLQIKRKSLRARIEGVDVYINDSQQAFSFFNIIFVPAKVDSLIVRHEQVHIRQMHYLDNLFIEILSIILWFNPVMIFYKRALKSEQEFLADHGAIQNLADVEVYLQCLLNATLSKSRTPLVSHFGSQLIKNRIIMLTKNKTPLYGAMLYFLIVPAVALLLVAFQDKPVSVSLNTNDAITGQQSIPDGSPVDISKVTKTFGFGERLHPATKKMANHTGVDFVTDEGVDVMATADGVVVETTFDELKGNFIVIRHSDQFATQYYHLLKSAVSRGATVKKGDVIGNVGSTGVLSTSNHLHYEILKDGKAVNPADYLPKGYLQD